MQGTVGLTWTNVTRNVKDSIDFFHELPEEQQPTHRIHSLLELNSLLQSYDLQFADAAFPSQSQD
jgi:hypothetical protein